MSDSPMLQKIFGDDRDRRLVEAGEAVGRAKGAYIHTHRLASAWKQKHGYDKDGVAAWIVRETFHPDV